MPDIFFRTLLIPALLLTACLQAQVLPVYALFDAKGRAVGHKQLVKQATAADIILFGELHNNALAHWLQLELARTLADAGPLVLGAEMIERDDQATLDRYLRGEIDQAALDTLARLWKNHRSDYQPLVDLARTRKLPFVATNVPRRLARAVNKGGFEALDTVPAHELPWMAVLPIPFDPELPRYKHMLTMMGDHATPNTVKAQALKDATMARSIAEHARAGVRFLHFNGSFHSDYYEGISWYLQRLTPSLRRFTIATVTQAQLKHLDTEHLGKADIILVVHEELPGSY
jgi:uncharacterized iron-regulated protein